MGIVHSKHSIIVSYYDFGRLLTSTGKTDWKQIGEAEERSVSSIWGTLNLRWFLTSMQKWKFQGWWSLMGCHLWGRTVGHNWSDLAAAAAAAAVLVSLKYHYMYIFIQQIFVDHLLHVKQSARCGLYLRQNVRCWESRAGSMVESKYGLYSHSW